MNNGLDLNVLGKNEESQMKVLCHMALTFRVKLNILSVIFKIDEDELFHKLFLANPERRMALRYLFQFDNTNEEEATIKFTKFYNDLLDAKLNNDLKRRNELIHMIDDSFIKGIKEMRKTKGMPLNLDDAAKLLRFQLKYALSRKELTKKFNVGDFVYMQKVEEYLDTDPTYKEAYEDLKNYNFNKRGHNKNVKF